MVPEGVLQGTQRDVFNLMLGHWWLRVIIRVISGQFKQMLVTINIHAVEWKVVFEFLVAVHLL